MLVTIIAIVLVFGVIIFVHELGHMLAAKSVGVAVPDFAMGMGPSLWHFKLGETRFHLCPFPIGGAVRVAGMEGDAADAPGIRLSGDVYPPHRTWQGKNGWQKAWILIAGPLMNVVLAFVLMIVIGFVGFPSNAVMVSSIENGQPAQAAGLRAGDLILAIDGVEMGSSQELISVIQNGGGQPLTLSVLRGSETLALAATPKQLGGEHGGNYSLGIGIGDVMYSTTTVAVVQPKSRGQQLKLRPGDKVLAINGQPVGNGWEIYTALALFDADLNPVDEKGNLLPEGSGEPFEITLERRGEVRTETLPGDTTAISFGVQFKPLLEHLPLNQSLRRSLAEAGNMMLAFLLGMKMLFTSEGVKTISGPVGIMDMIGQSAKAGWYTFLTIIILINLNLGLINLLPLPALDGGRLVFVTLAGIGVKIPEQREATVHAVGMFMLLGLIAVITLTDILAYF